MNLLINLNKLYELKIEPQMYCWLYLQYIGEIDKSWLFSSIDANALVYLQSIQYIKILDHNPEPEVMLRKNALDLFEQLEPERKWLEFKSKYPIKSSNSRLHDNQQGCRLKYDTLIGEHSNIIKGLENELLARTNAAKKGEFFPSQKIMSAWLNRRHWEVYLDYTEDSDGEVKEERL